jgi:hypothetical protein
LTDLTNGFIQLLAEKEGEMACKQRCASYESDNQQYIAHRIPKYRM